MAQLKSNYTPGPWEIEVAPDEANAYDIFKMISEDVGIGIATVRGDNPEFDAQLIAAAPDLLEACKELLSAFGSPGNLPLWASAMKKIEFVVAKAEGKQ